MGFEELLVSQSLQNALHHKNELTYFRYRVCHFIDPHFSSSDQVYIMYMYIYITWENDITKDLVFSHTRKLCGKTQGFFHLRGAIKMDKKYSLISS